MTNNQSSDARPLDVVLDRIAGGHESELARLLDISRSAVSCWRSIKRRGNEAAGTIPGKYHKRILEIAQTRGVPLSHGELLGL